jgi:hypothetical protein
MTRSTRSNFIYGIGIGIGVSLRLGVGCAQLEQDAVFAAADESQIHRTVGAALGETAGYAMLFAMTAGMDAEAIFSDQEAPACPALEELGTDPLVIRYTADGCLAESGLWYDGAVTTTNAPSFWGSLAGDDGVDYDSGFEMQFDTFTVGPPDASMTFDGRLEASAPNDAANSVLTVDLSVDDPDFSNTTTMTIHCSLDDAMTGDCRIGEGAVGQTEGLGSFSIGGQYDQGPTGVVGGEVELVGADTLRIELEPDGDGCLPLSVDGESIAPYCPPQAG